MTAYGCCVGSWDRFARYVVPRVNGRTLLGLAGQASIAEAYNAILDALADRGEAVVLLHDDLELIDPAGEAKLLAPLTNPAVGLVGVAGGGTSRGLAWWDDHPIGHQLTDSLLIDFGVRNGDVEHVEGSIMVLAPWVVAGIRFDTCHPGFHGYDEIGTVVRRRRGRVVVVDVDTHHHTTVGFRSEASADEWRRADELFRRKWP